MKKMQHIVLFGLLVILFIAIGCGRDSPTITSSIEEDLSPAPHALAQKTAAIPRPPIDVAADKNFAKSDIKVLWSAGTVTIVDLVSDEDNFGYGGTANPPCVFYNLSHPVIDLGIFDRELISGDEVESWTHDFTSSLCPGFTATSVLVEIPEKFSDFTASTITIDSTTLDFTPNGFTQCGPFILQTFLFTGTAAAFANDGIVNITFRENGDDIALDYCRLTVTGTCDVELDIKPGDCPNYLDIQSVGILPVAILGTDNFDVNDIDPDSVRLEGIAPVGGRDRQDVTTPVVGRQNVCDCTTGGDDIADLSFGFSIPELRVALGDLEPVDEVEVVLTLTGVLRDGTPFEGKDCVVILNR